MKTIENIALANNTNASTIEEKPVVKTKGIPRPGRLPLGMFDRNSGRWFRGFDIKKMHSDALLKFEKEQNPYKAFGAIVAQGLSIIYDIETGDELEDWKGKTSKLFFQDIFFLMVEIIILTKGTSLVPTVYRCPQCKSFTRFENPVGESADMSDGFDLTSSADELSSLDMEDLREIPFRTMDLEEPVLDFHFKSGVEIENKLYADYSFRIPEIGDYIAKAGQTADAAGEKKVLFHCLESVNGLRGRDLQELKSKYGLALLGFDVVDYMKIVNKLNGVGYTFKNHKVCCSACGLEFKTTFDLTNFFGALLGR